MLWNEATSQDSIRNPKKKQWLKSLAVPNGYLACAKSMQLHVYSRVGCMGAIRSLYRSRFTQRDLTRSPQRVSNISSLGIFPFCFLFFGLPKWPLRSYRIRSMAIRSFLSIKTRYLNWSRFFYNRCINLRTGALNTTLDFT